MVSVAKRWGLRVESDTGLGSRYLLDMVMTEQQVRSEVRQWLSHNWDETTVRSEWIETVTDSGWAAPSWPVEWLGKGLDSSLSGVVASEFARVGAYGTGHDKTNLWANTLLSFGSNELKSALLRDLMLGSINMCLLYSEPGAGSDLAGVQTRAERDGDEWIVTGQKVWTSGARMADYALLIARTDLDAPKHRGISFFWFPMDQPGVEVRPLRQATGDSRFNEVFLTEARVPHANMLGEQNNGWMVLQTALAYERSVMGESQRRRSTGEENKAVRSAGDENPAPIPDLSLVALAQDTGSSQDPIIRQRIAQLYCMVTVNDWNNRRAKAEMAQGTSSSAMSLGKLAMSQILHTAASIQTSILGAEAMTGGEDSPRAADAAYSLLNAFFTSIGGGTDQIQRNIIGERILGLPKEPEIDKTIPFREVLRSPSR